MYSKNRLFARFAPRPAAKSTLTALTTPDTMTWVPHHESLNRAVRGTWRCVHVQHRRAHTRPPNPVSAHTPLSVGCGPHLDGQVQSLGFWLVRDVTSLVLKPEPRRPITYRIFCQSTVTADARSGSITLLRHLLPGQALGGSYFPSTKWHVTVSPQRGHTKAMRLTSGRTPATRTTFPFTVTSLPVTTPHPRHTRLVIPIDVQAPHGVHTHRWRWLSKYASV